MNKTIKHLEFIQGIINRMASNSFMIKGWCITLVTACFALSVQCWNGKFIYIAFIPVISFYLLDGYYLWKERQFRALHDQVRIKEDNNIDFSLDVSKIKGWKYSWLGSLLSATLGVYYLSLVLAMLIVITVVNC